MKFDDNDWMVPSTDARDIERAEASINFVMRPTSTNKVLETNLQTSYGFDFPIWFNKPALNRIRFDTSYTLSNFTSDDLILVPDRMNSFVYGKYYNGFSLYLNGMKSKKEGYEGQYLFTVKGLGGNGSFDFSEMIAWRSYVEKEVLNDDDVTSLYEDQKRFFELP